jgi:hypothetical protein
MARNISLEYQKPFKEREPSRTMGLRQAVISHLEGSRKSLT